MKALLFALLVACNTPPPQPRVYGIDASDACVSACAKLGAWGCSEGQPSLSGELCESFCARESQLLNPSCVANAATKADLAACGVRCQP